MKDNNIKKLKDEMESLNIKDLDFDNLDVEELEHRIELAAVLVVTSATEGCNCKRLTINLPPQQ